MTTQPNKIVIALDVLKTDVCYLRSLIKLLAKKAQLEFSKVYREMLMRDFKHLISVFKKYFDKFVVLVE